MGSMEIKYKTSLRVTIEIILSFCTTKKKSFVKLALAVNAIKLFSTEVAAKKLRIFSPYKYI